MSYRTDSFIASLGLEAYRVGGSVRDEVLGRKPKDADYMIRGAELNEIGTNLKEACRSYTLNNGPSSVKPLVLRDGRQAGWRVSACGLGCIEIVLPRTERSTGPGHRDFEIVLDPDLPLAEDAKRRDFTFNALYKRIPVYDCCAECDYGGEDDGTHGVVDPTGRGLYDLTHRQINVTHADSFRDDPLRILRALRFISTLDYDLGRETQALMMLHAEHVAGLTIKGYVSGTVLDEFSKLLMGQAPAKALRVARDAGVLGVALPELAPMLGFAQGSRYHDMTTDEHTFTALETAAHVDAPLRVRWALLFHDSGKPDTAWVGKDGRKHYYKQFKELTRASIMHAPGTARINADHEDHGTVLWLRAAKSLQADKHLRNDVATLIQNHMVPCQKANMTKVRRARVQLGDEMLRDLYLMRMCDLSGKGNKNRDFLLNVALMEIERARCEASGVPCKASELAINGHDVIALGAQGRDIGGVLATVLDEVACDPSLLKLSRDWQLRRAEVAAGR